MFFKNKQIFHAFLINIRYYSTELINIQQREAELNIILPRVNNFDIKQRKAWNICFIIRHQPQTRSGKTRAKQSKSITTQVFFLKTKLKHVELQVLVNHFILLLLIYFSEIIKR